MLLCFLVMMHGKYDCLFIYVEFNDLFPHVFESSQLCVFERS